MENLIQFFTFIVLIGILIIVHEFGHFIVARRCGVRVEKFSIGFGPALFKRKGKATEFSIRAFPLGGFVKMAGDTRAEVSGKADEFISKPIGAKMAIVFSGPLFNYLFGFVLFWIITMVGIIYTDPIVGALKPGYPAEKAGVLAGDKIVRINGHAIDSWATMQMLIRTSKNKVNLLVERNGEKLAIEVPLRKREEVNEEGKKIKVGQIGIVSPQQVPRIVKYDALRAIPKAIDQMFLMTSMIASGFVDLFLGRVAASEVAGPLGIYHYTGLAVRAGFTAVLSLMALLTVSLAIVNLLPLPILDGGHIALFIIEKIRAKPLSQSAEDIIGRIGYAMLAVLMALVFYNDINNRFGPKLWGNKLFHKDSPVIQTQDK